jgi:uncharacterized protein (DUF486 family)
VKHLIVITYVARTDIVLIVVSIAVAVAAVIYVVATCRTRIVPIVVQISGIGVLIAIVVIAIVVIATISYGAEAIAWSRFIATAAYVRACSRLHSLFVRACIPIYC